MEKSTDLIKIKVLISGRTKSYSIDVNRNMRISNLSNSLCQYFNFQINNTKIILNNKPLEKYKDQIINTAISKDKKPFIIIYFNKELEDKENNSNSDKNANFPNRANNLNMKYVNDRSLSKETLLSKRSYLVDNIKTSILNESNRQIQNLNNTLKEKKKASLNKSTESRLSFHTTHGKRSSIDFQNLNPVLYYNKPKNISPRELERKKYIFNKEIENIDNEMKKLNQLSLDIKEFESFNGVKIQEIDTMQNNLVVYENEFEKIIEKVNKIKDLISSNIQIKINNIQENKNKIDSSLSLIKQKYEVFNKSLIKVNKLYSDLFENVDLENFDELNNVRFSSNIYKILEAIYERKQEYDEIKSNLKEINKNVYEISFNPESIINFLKEKLNILYLEISSNANSNEINSRESIQDISTKPLELKQHGTKENFTYKINHESNDAGINNRSNFIRENDQKHNKRVSVSHGGINEINSNNNTLDKNNSNTLFNTIISGNKNNTINYNDEIINAYSKFSSSNKKQDLSDYNIINNNNKINNFNVEGKFNNENFGKKIYSAENEMKKENDFSSSMNNNKSNNNNSIFQRRIIYKSEEKVNLENNNNSNHNSLRSNRNIELQNNTSGNKQTFSNNSISNLYLINNKNSISESENKNIDSNQKVSKKSFSNLNINNNYENQSDSNHLYHNSRNNYKNNNDPNIKNIGNINAQENHHSPEKNGFNNPNPPSNYHSYNNNYNNIIKNIPSQIKNIEEIFSVEKNKKTTNDETLTNNNIASSNGFNSAYMSNYYTSNNYNLIADESNNNNNNFNFNPIFQLKNNYNNSSNNPNLNNLISYSNQKSNISDMDQTPFKTSGLSSNTMSNNINKVLISLNENSNQLVTHNPITKETTTHEISFPLDAKENKFYWNSRLIQNNSDVFITGGHNDNNISSKKCYYLNLNVFSYQNYSSFNMNTKIHSNNNNKTCRNVNISELKPMNFSRWGHSMVLFSEKYLFCISGYNNKKCEYLDIQYNKWKNISELNIWRLDCSLFIFNNTHLYVFGGFNDNNKFTKPFVKKIEKLKIFNKGVDIPSSINKWEFVNLFDDKTENASLSYLIPCMGIIPVSDNKLILLGGDTSDYANMADEISNRSLKNNLNGNFGENNHNNLNNMSLNKNNKLEFHNRLFLIKINFIGNCEISELTQRLEKPSCFSITKQFLLFNDNSYYGFAQGLEVCEVKNNFNFN